MHHPDLPTRPGILHRVWRTGRDVIHLAGNTQLGLISAGVAFFGFLAVFPAAAAIIAIWGFVNNPEVIRSQIAVLDEFLPHDAFLVLDGQVQALITANSSTLGWTTALTTIFALWSARAGVGALISGLDSVYRTQSRNGFWHIVQASLLTLILMGVALTSVVVAVIIPILLAVLPIGPSIAPVLEHANLWIGMVVVVFGISLAYRYGPNHTRRPPLLTLGLALAVMMWFAASRGLVIYLANFGNYNQVYGSIGAVVALLMWFYLSSYAILLGAVVDSVRSARRLDGPDGI